MRKAMDLLGLPVIDIRLGRRLGSAKDLVFNANWSVVCVLLQPKTWYSAARCVRWEDVLYFGDDAVTVPHRRVICSCREEKDHHVLLDGKRKLRGLPVLTAGGTQLGTLADVYLSQEVDKRIVGFELTEGFLSDITEGRRWLPLPEKAALGEDVIMVPVHCIQEVRELTKQE